MKKFLAIFLVLVVGLCVVIHMQSDQMRVSRSIVIEAPSEQVFLQVNNFRNWSKWSPWAEMDPNQQTDFEGPLSGVGARMSWDGNKDVGQGINTITVSEPNKRIQTRLEFLKPFKATNNAEFIFEEQNNQTRVTWSMTGTKNFIMKAIGLVMDCDKMIGPQFETGLSNLKQLVE